jgi:hypothetical protein
MVQCPKCQKKLNPIRLVYRGDFNCPACQVHLALENQKSLSIFSLFLAGIVVGVIGEILEASGQAPTSSWRIILGLWLLMILINIILIAFFGRIRIKALEDKLLNLN